MKRYRGCLIFAFTFFLFGNSLSEGSGATNPKEKLIITGSGSSIGTMQRIGEVFQKKHPDVIVTVPPSIGSTGAIKAVKADQIEIGLIYRPLTPEEHSPDIIVEPYGRTAFVFGVQESNPTKGLMLTEIEDIYARRRNTWSDGTPIRLILRPLSDGFSVYLGSINSRLKSASEEAHAIPGVFIGMTDQEAADQIEKTPGSIGTTSASLIASGKRKIKALSIDGTPPTLSTIAVSSTLSTARYPYTMTLSLVYKKGKYQGAVKDFIDFVFSSNGRKLLSENGQLALPRMTTR
jgi:phosphate transport system substrate-binding protein